MLACSLLLLVLADAEAQYFQRYTPGTEWYSITSLPAGGHLLAGTGLQNLDDLRVAAIDPNGSLAWIRSLNASGTGVSLDGLHSRNILTLDGDSLVVSVYIAEGAAGGAHGAVFKTGLDASAGRVARYRFGQAGPGRIPRGGISAMFRSLATGDHVFAGWSNPGVPGDGLDYGAHILRTDAWGNVIWTKHLRTSFDFFFDCVEGPGGASVFAGGSRTPRVHATDINGTRTWSYSYNMGGDHEILRIIRAWDNGYIVVGNHINPSGTDRNGFIMKLSYAGAVEWARSVGGSQEDLFQSVERMPGGGYAVCGSTRSYGAGGADGWILAIDNNGSPAWAYCYGTPGDEGLNGLSVSATGIRAVGYASGGGWYIGTTPSGELGCNDQVVSPWMVDITAIVVRTEVNYVESGYTDRLPETFHIANIAPISTVACASTLPVELLSFQGWPTNAGVELRWTTASERNSSHFTVQRSVDGTTWTDIGRVEAAGNSQQLVAYTFIEAAPPTGLSFLYYRLRQVDLDGTATMYETVVTFPSPKDDAALVVFPNPATDEVYARVSGPVLNGAALIQLMDGQGRIVRSMPLSAGDRAEVRIDLGGLAPGVYAVTIAGALSHAVRPVRVIKR
ncbi:MAG: hypothetical protein QM724_00430 [Flavobacteriales bacterium]